MNRDGTDQVLVARHPDHLYFAPTWSPDGKWLLYGDCHHKEDPGHDWADVCIGRPDGSEHRVLTTGQPLWFSPTYGNPQNYGNGSNGPEWAPNGTIVYVHKLPGSKPAWEFQPSRPDTDHFNRDYKPESARGGTEICRLDPKTGALTQLTHSDPPQWNHHNATSRDGRKIIFCRSGIGESPAIWVMNSDGQRPALLTRGMDNRGAVGPAWLG